jgi:hypothetical protein
MNEAAAREVVLVQAFETAHPPPAAWSDEDRSWATRAALEDAGGSGAEGFVARRAHHALQRLLPREPTLAVWLARRLWRWHWLAGAAAFGLIAGLCADSIGGSQRINLLAPPLWGVLAWNLVVYVILLGHGLARVFLRRPRGGALVRLTERALRFGRGLSTRGAVAANVDVLKSFTHEWWRISAPLSTARATLLLHVAAAALALGLIVGLYARGLVLDYRAAWESTFLSADQAHAMLSAVLAPARALTDIAMPDTAGFVAMRSVHGAPPVGAPAAPWIHLLALTLVLLVVLPRALLATFAAVRAHWLARHVTRPLDGAYFEALARAARGDVARVLVAPYAGSPGPAALKTVRALLARALGDTTQVETAATTAFGAEDAAAAPVQLPAGTTLVAALFDLSATPELENQGRFARRLALHVPTLLLIDEAAFAQRFQADPARLGQRREAWRVLATALHTTPVFFAGGADGEADAHAVTLALRRPVSAA